MRKILAIVIGIFILLAFFYLANMKVTQTADFINLRHPSEVFKPLIDRLFN